ncbi:hypothetical protein MCOR25_004105 [Pyricularia grisea]|nr:hypothetical protein MCOR25_004105 [Pyricularia grisea]
MKLRSIVFVSSLAITALAGPDTAAITDKSPAAVAAADTKAGSTKDAPVDGKDGRPHHGPFVEIENLRDKGSSAASSNSDIPSLKKDLPVLKDRPSDPTVVNGKKIPESNDGIMDDKNRAHPKEGTTGTSGGVSEKDRERKAKEGQTGERVEKKPETPKEARPLSHSEQEKVMKNGGGKDVKDKDLASLKDTKAKLASSMDKDSKEKAEDTDKFSGLDKPSDLPGKTHDKTLPIPDSANKDHLDVTQGKKQPLSTGKTPQLAAGADGVLQPLHSFCLSLTMILFSEIGDKTFLVAALMAMKHDRMVVFSAAFSALITMTILSAFLGHAVPALIPKKLTSFMAAGLFFVFGARMLREGMAMSPDEGVTAEMHEVELELEEKESLARKQGIRGRASPHALEMGLGGNGHTSRKSRGHNSRFSAPHRSPSTSPSRSPSPRRGGSVMSALAGLNNLLSLLLSPAWVQTFVMTFLGEWGDRSQIATIAMAAGQDYWWVTLGAVLGHACCTGVAVIGGRAIAGKVSLKVVTVGGALAFLLFGFIYFIEAFYT